MQVKMEHIIVPDVMAVENDTIDDVGAIGNMFGEEGDASDY